MIQIRVDDPRSPAVTDLLAFHLESARGRLPREHAHALDADGLARPGVTFWSAWDGSSLAGIAALRDLGDGHGEIKSMRTAADHVRKGVARALLDHLLASARSMGLSRLSLETGTDGFFDPAIRLYQSVGFVDCDAFGGYPPSPHNRFMTLPLGAA